MSCPSTITTKRSFVDQTKKYSGERQINHWSRQLSYELKKPLNGVPVNKDKVKWLIIPDSSEHKRDNVSTEGLICINPVKPGSICSIIWKNLVTKFRPISSILIDFRLNKPENRILSEIIKEIFNVFSGIFYMKFGDKVQRIAIPRPSIWVICHTIPTHNYLGMYQLYSINNGQLIPNFPRNKVTIGKTPTKIVDTETNLRLVDDKLCTVSNFMMNERMEDQTNDENEAVELLNGWIKQRFVETSGGWRTVPSVPLNKTDGATKTIVKKKVGKKRDRSTVIELTRPIIPKSKRTN